MIDEDQRNAWRSAVDEEVVAEAAAAQEVDLQILRAIRLPVLDRLVVPEADQ